MHGPLLANPYPNPHARAHTVWLQGDVEFCAIMPATSMDSYKRYTPPRPRAPHTYACLLLYLVLGEDNADFDLAVYLALTMVPLRG